MLPRITLVTPSYNQAAFLEMAIQSVILQAYPNLEYIVMDGGSADGSIEILRRYEKQFAYWTSAHDAGQSDALNRGFARATGAIFGWLNSDDLLLPNALQTVGAYFGAHPECDFLTGDGVFINADNTRELYVARGAAYTFDELLEFYNDKYLPQPSVFFSRVAFEQVGGLDVSLHYAMDLDLWLRIRQQFELHSIPHRLSLLRVHPAAKGEQREQPTLRVVAQVTSRYWDHVSRMRRAQIFWGLRRMRAHKYCAQGLADVLQGDRRAAWSALGSAIAQDPFTMVSDKGRPLLARLVLPMALRRRILHAP